MLLIVSVGCHSCGSSRLFKVFMRYALVDYAMRHVHMADGCDALSMTPHCRCNCLGNALG